MFDSDLMAEVRARFAHVDRCPFTGPRVFFENAGGALTLRSVVDTSARLAAIPDNQGRDNPASAALMQMIARGRDDTRLLFNAPGGQIVVGESGTELLFRLIRAACLAAHDPDAPGGRVLGSTLEHPATRSAAGQWARAAGLRHVMVDHDPAGGTVTAGAYAAQVTPDTRVATIVHASPVTGIGVDIAQVAQAIRSVAPDCVIVVDGIQHAAHGGIDLSDAEVDGYVISPYKVFSRHGYGIAWMSDRLSALPHDHLAGAPGAPWELGTRDTAAYATMTDVVNHFDWLGARMGAEGDRRARIVAAGRAIRAQETALTDALLHGTANLPGLTALPGVTILGGAGNPAREGLVCFALDDVPAPDIVAGLNAAGIRTHLRKPDHYSGTILTPLGLPGCVRVSLAHYNSLDEVAQCLEALRDIARGQTSAAS